MKRVIEQTADGSATLFIPEMDEHYHSVKGARTESQHIFIDMGLNHSPLKSVSILEIGFGTGLNAILTLEEAVKQQRSISYTSIERYPLSWEVVSELSYSDNPDFEKMHTALWNEEAIINPWFALMKVEADANQWINGVKAETIDLVYFDAFAPEKQPEMWSQELFNRIYAAMRSGAILTTYCAKGVIRRMLQASGFMVERLPGPPGGKREILRATKN